MGLKSRCAQPSDTHAVSQQRCGTAARRDGGSEATVLHSDVQGGFAGIGDMNADPMFVDPDNGDVRLQPGSPCIDAADNTAVPPGVTTDLDGDPRFAKRFGDNRYGKRRMPGCGHGLVRVPHVVPVWDLDCDANVGITDFLALLAAWGTDPGGPPDLDG